MGWLLKPGLHGLGDVLSVFEDSGLKPPNGGIQLRSPPNMLRRSDEGNYFLRRPTLPRGTKTPLHALKYSIGEHVWVEGRLTLED